MPRKKTPPKKTTTKTEDQLTKELIELTKEVKKLKNLEFMKIFKHPFKFMWFSLLKGLMVGFGSVLGATVLVALFVYIIAQISFVPIIGDFIENVIVEVTESTGIEEQPQEQPHEQNKIDQDMIDQITESTQETEEPFKTDVSATIPAAVTEVLE